MICKAKNDMNGGKLIAALMFDMSAAFDTVQIDIVINKLKLLGLSKDALEWIKRYLSERKQKVKIDEKESKPEVLTLGTPQGSRLSPLLFNILTCDLDLYMKNGMCCNFADDTSLSVEAKTKPEMIEKLEKDAEGMTEFTSSNNLVLNPGKTALICKGQNATVRIGHSGTKKETNKPTLIEQVKVQTAESWTQTQQEEKNTEKDSQTNNKDWRFRGQSTCTKDSWAQVNTIVASKTTDLLGMTIQGDLRWDSHIIDLKKTLKKRIGVLTRLRHLIPKKSLKMAAEAIFTSKLRFGIATYLRPKIKRDDESNQNLNELTKIQNDMLRVITGKKLSDHVTLENLRRTTRTMSVNQLCIYHIMLETYGIVNLKSSTVLRKMLTKKYSENNAPVLRSSKKDEMLQIPPDEGRNNAFNFYAATAWNKFQTWLKNENRKKQDNQHSITFEKECSLKLGLGLKCCCKSKFCKNVTLTRPRTEKEILLKQRKETERALKEFKRQIKVWILKDIPQD